MGNIYLPVDMGVYAERDNTLRGRKVVASHHFSMRYFKRAISNLKYKNKEYSDKYFWKSFVFSEISENFSLQKFLAIQYIVGI